MQPNLTLFLTNPEPLSIDQYQIEMLLYGFALGTKTATFELEHFAL